MTRCTEIDRLILVKAPNVKSVVDSCVRKATETRRLVERYDSIHADAKHLRLLENFTRAEKKLEETIKKFSLHQQQKQVLPPAVVPTRELSTFGKSTSAPSIPSSYAYVSSMEEGSSVLSDLTRINKDMNSLQDMYYSLSEVAVNQQATLIDSVQHKISQASTSAKNTLEQLAVAKDKMDYWTRVKVYTLAGVSAIGILVWLI